MDLRFGPTMWVSNAHYEMHTTRPRIARLFGARTGLPAICEVNSSDELDEVHRVPGQRVTQALGHAHVV